MESSNEQDKNNVPAEQQRLQKDLEQRLKQDGELSEAWRMLLG